MCYRCLPVCTPWFWCFELVVIVRDVANEHKQRPVMYDNKEMLISAGTDSICETLS